MIVKPPMHEMIAEHKRLEAEIAAEPSPWLSFKNLDLHKVTQLMEERARELLDWECEDVLSRRNRDWADEARIFIKQSEIRAFLLFRELNRETA